MFADSGSNAADQGLSPSMSLGISPAAKERADRHFQRAKEQLKLKNSNLAVQELRDAIQADPANAEYHAWMAKIQLQKGLTGMATISLRQALKLDPTNTTALECKQSLTTQKNTPPSSKPDRGSGLLGGLFSKR